MTSSDEGDMEIDASPTKEFFISMLVKDIQLIEAIIDLVDNCVDGARRMRGTGDLKNLTVRLDVNESRFLLEDNCGGIPVDVARDYAFRFGRPSGMPSTKHSIGQFGVGMKRALFKLGTRFQIESTSTNSRFLVEVDVNEWKSSDEDHWHFEFKELEENLDLPETDTGTTVTVDRLHNTVTSDFGLENFVTRLRNEIRDRHQRATSDGLSVSVNGIPVNIRLAEFLRSSTLKPAYLKKTYPEDVNVNLYVGVADSEPTHAGWYVFCNGRLVLKANKEEATGWGAGDEKTIPRYHNQFARFRGYAFFDCDDPSQLPWNTTKMGLDEESPLYRAVRQEMIGLARPVIDFLNELKEEREDDSDQKHLSEALDEAEPVLIGKIRMRSSFKAPQRPEPSDEPKTRNIQYSKPVDQIDQVMKKLKTKTLKVVGEKTFEYYYELECDE